MADEPTAAPTHGDLSDAINESIVEQGYGGTDIDSGHIATSVLELMADDEPHAFCVTAQQYEDAIARAERAEAAAPIRPTREQVRAAVVSVRGGPDDRYPFQALGEMSEIPDKVTDAVMALLAGEGTAQPDPSKWAERVREATTEVLDQKDLVVGLEAMCDHGSKQWAQLVYNSHERLRRASGDGTAPQPGTVTATYTNWQNETAERHFIPVSLWWGVTEWHPRSGWHLDAFDIDRQAMRSFALSGFDHNVIPLAHRGTAPQVPAEADGALSILRRLAITDDDYEWEIDTAPSGSLQWVRTDRDSRSWEYFEPLSEAEQAAWRRVVAADGAPQEGDER